MWFLKGVFIFFYLKLCWGRGMSILNDFLGLGIVVYEVGFVFFNEVEVGRGSG